MNPHQILNQSSYDKISRVLRGPYNAQNGISLPQISPNDVLQAWVHVIFRAFWTRG